MQLTFASSLANAKNEISYESYIYTRVSTNEQKTGRQVKDLQDTGYEVVKVFFEKVLGISKAMAERQELQHALSYLERDGIRWLLIQEISRWGGTTTVVLNLLKKPLDALVTVWTIKIAYVRCVNRNVGCT